VKLGATSITEETIAAELPKMANLKKLDLSQTQIGDAAMDSVAKLEGLEWLNLYGTQVTDAGIMTLKGLGNLKKIYLWQSKATPEGAKALQAELPGLEVVFGVN
jgi:Leucine-rich repeat (LRR) protein